MINRDHCPESTSFGKIGVQMKIVFVTLLALFSVCVIASEAPDEEIHNDEEAHLKHALAVFVGATIEGAHSRETLGFEYSYRINSNWSLGGVIERTEEDHSTLVIAFAHLWPYKGLFLGFGVGRKDPGDSRENTLRATIGYEFELPGGWAIAPQANLDVIEGHENEEVYGIAIGKRF
jgi:hypothetical protein